SAQNTSSTCASSSNGSPTIGRRPRTPLARMMEHQPARLRRGSYCLLVSLPQEHAFGVEDNPLISPPFPIRFSEWVTSDECCWSTLAKRPRANGSRRIEGEPIKD